MRLDDHRCESRTRRPHPARLRSTAPPGRRWALRKNAATGRRRPTRAARGTPPSRRGSGSAPTSRARRRARRRRRHDDGSSGEEGVIALIPRSSVYVARFITARAPHPSRGLPGRRRRPTDADASSGIPACAPFYDLLCLCFRARSRRRSLDEPSLSQQSKLGGAPPADVEPTPSPRPAPAPAAHLPAAARRRRLLTRADAPSAAPQGVCLVLAIQQFHDRCKLRGKCRRAWRRRRTSPSRWRCSRPTSRALSSPRRTSRSGRPGQRHLVRCLRLRRRGGARQDVQDAAGTGVVPRDHRDAAAGAAAEAQLCGAAAQLHQGGRPLFTLQVTPLVDRQGAVTHYLGVVLARFLDSNRSSRRRGSTSRSPSAAGKTGSAAALGGGGARRRSHPTRGAVVDCGASSATRRGATRARSRGRSSWWRRRRAEPLAEDAGSSSSRGARAALPLTEIVGGAARRRDVQRRGGVVLHPQPRQVCEGGLLATFKHNKLGSFSQQLSHLRLPPQDRGVVPRLGGRVLPRPVPGRLGRLPQLRRSGRRDVEATGLLPARGGGGGAAPAHRRRDRRPRSPPKHLALASAGASPPLPLAPPSFLAPLSTAPRPAVPPPPLLTPPFRPILPPGESVARDPATDDPDQLTLAKTPRAERKRTSRRCRPPRRWCRSRRRQRRAAAAARRRRPKAERPRRRRRRCRRRRRRVRGRRPRGGARDAAACRFWRVGPPRGLALARGAPLPGAPRRARGGHRAERRRVDHAAGVGVARQRAGRGGGALDGDALQMFADSCTNFVDNTSGRLSVGNLPVGNNGSFSVDNRAGAVPGQRRPPATCRRSESGLATVTKGRSCEYNMTCGPWRHENVFNIDMLDAQPFIYERALHAEALRYAGIRDGACSRPGVGQHAQPLVLQQAHHSVAGVNFTFLSSSHGSRHRHHAAALPPAPRLQPAAAAAAPLALEQRQLNAPLAKNARPTARTALEQRRMMVAPCAPRGRARRRSPPRRFADDVLCRRGTRRATAAPAART